MAIEKSFKNSIVKQLRGFIIVKRFQELKKNNGQKSQSVEEEKVEQKPYKYYGQRQLEESDNTSEDEKERIKRDRNILVRSYEEPQFKKKP